jgi:hypothetical protein
MGADEKLPRYSLALDESNPSLLISMLTFHECEFELLISTYLIAHCFSNMHNIQQKQTINLQDSKTMSSKKTSKIEVKSEVTSVASKKRKRGKDSNNDAIDVPASAVKKDKSEVKPAVKLEVIEMPAKKRKRGNGDKDDDVKDAISDHVSDVSVRKKKKKRKQAKRHACTEPGCGKDCASPSKLIIHFRGHTGEKPFACD